MILTHSKKPRNYKLTIPIMNVRCVKLHRLNVETPIITSNKKGYRQNILINPSDKMIFILDVINKFIPIDLYLIVSKRRDGYIVKTRHMLAYLMGKYTDKTLITIGGEMGGRDHATINHAIKNVNNFMFTDKKYRKQVEEIENELLLTKKF
jgi:chromosomal replication initiation ATPase DnaA